MEEKVEEELEGKRRKKTEERKKENNIYSKVRMLLPLVDPKGGEYFHKLLQRVI